MSPLMVGQVLYGCPEFTPMPWDEHRVEAVGADWVVVREVGCVEHRPQLATGDDVHEHLARYLTPREDEA